MMTKELREYVDREIAELDKNSLVDERIDCESYIPNKSDVINLSYDQAMHLYDSVRLDFDTVDDIRENHISSDDWSEDSENYWHWLHKRYIIVRKLLTKYCGLHFNYQDKKYFNIHNIKTQKTLYLKRARLYYLREFHYSRLYDEIESDSWNDKFQEEYDKLINIVNKINEEINIRSGG